MSRSIRAADLDGDQYGFLRSVSLRWDLVSDTSRYPFCIPALRLLDDVVLHPRVTYFVGENGCGKSTLLEAIAIRAGFNAEGGTRNFNFATRRSESELHRNLRLVRGARRERTGYFFRAESFFNVATQIEVLDSVACAARPVIESYGRTSLHEQSHGESFLALIRSRFGSDGLYILDEPEAALSPGRQLTLLARIHELVQAGRSQFIIATHSPIVLAYPDATIYLLSNNGVIPVRYEDTEHVSLTRDFLLHRERFLRDLLGQPAK